MSENENLLNEETQPEQPATEQIKAEKPKGGAGAAVKEWFRKKIVNLKRAPQNITFLFLVVTSFLYLIWLFTFSKAIYITQAATWTGIAVFVNTLLSILILALFLNAFPKRKKASKVFVALLFVFMVAIVLFDVLFYVQESNYIYAQENFEGYIEAYPYLVTSLNLTIAHIVLIGICALLLATLPLYKKLIMKINTRKVVESNQLKEEIDTSEEE